MTPKIPHRGRGLDLFSGAGGAAKGYELNGWEMTGVDHRPMKTYVGKGGHIVADYRKVLEDEAWVRSFDFIHASPPCQIFSSTRHMGKNRFIDNKVDELTPLTEIIYERYADMVWIIENVDTCPIETDDTQTIMLCGSMFNLTGLYEPHRQLRRHRKFRLHNMPAVPQPACRHNGIKALGVYGSSADPGMHRSGDVAYDLDEGRKLMGINWMTWRLLKEAIPPAYTHYIAPFIPEKKLKVVDPWADDLPW